MVVPGSAAGWTVHRFACGTGCGMRPLRGGSPFRKRVPVCMLAPDGAGVCSGAAAGSERAPDRRVSRPSSPRAWREAVDPAFAGIAGWAVEQLCNRAVAPALTAGPLDLLPAESER